MKILLLTLSIIAIQPSLVAYAAAEVDSLQPYTDGSITASYPNYHEEFAEERDRAIQKATINGREEGRHDVKIETAQRMIITLHAYTDKNIATITGLSEETIADLRRKIEAKKAAEQKKE